ncbi:MAG: LA_2272 family surface repeat-containing protein, partial [Bacteroidota bacterium]
LRGLQIGIYNKTTRIRGLQIGLWNVSEKRKRPIINF